MIGQTISHYKILEKLGEGGMGVVYKAHDTKLDRDVALKFLPAELIRDYEAKERFIHEAKAASALDHNNICTIHEIGQTDDDRLFMAMAYYEGETLKDKIKHGPLKVEGTIDIAVQVAQGLARAHEAGIVHRDIKPANIMITNRSEVKIVDFGLAKLSSLTRLTKTGSTIGTVAYMSPEQARGEGVDHRTDIWSLGVILYEMLTGQLLFKSEYEQAMVYSILNEEPKPIPELRNDVPPGLVQIIKRATAKKVEDRYQNIYEMLEDLKAARGGQAIQFKRGHHKVKLWQLVIASTALITLALILLLLFFPSNDIARNRKSIAVLPFKNMSDSKEDEYFSDGITEDVINQISKMPGLAVISRTSVMVYKNSNKSIWDIGKDLNVDVILESSVRRSNDRIRIVSKLIDVNTDNPIWSESYDRPFQDVFEIQSDVAQNISRAMTLKLGPDSLKIIKQRPIGEITAYDYYLKGREYYYRFRKKDNEKAITYFEKAIALEPRYTIALAGLADAYSQGVAKFGYSPNWIDSALDLSSEAVNIDFSVSEAHKALALAYSGKGWHQQAIQCYLKSIVLNPNYVTAIGNLGAEYSFIGEYYNALTWFKKAVPLDPTFPFSYYTVGGTYSNLDNYEKAMEWFNKCLQIDPDFQFVHGGLGIMYLRQGKYQQSYAEAMAILSKAPNDLEGLSLAGWAKIFAGDYKGAKEFFKMAISIDSTGTYWYGCGRSSYTALGFINLMSGDQLKAFDLLRHSRKLDQIQLEKKSEWYTIRYDLALISALESKKNEAYRWLREAVDLGWRDYHLGQRDPLMKTLLKDKDFKEIIHKVESYIKEMRKRAADSEGKDWNS
jgi:serine/threonine protein kinase/Flp pilus assembly protein TadD